MGDFRHTEHLLGKEKQDRSKMLTNKYFYIVRSKMLTNKYFNIVRCKCWLTSILILFYGPKSLKPTNRLLIFLAKCQWSTKMAENENHVVKNCCHFFVRKGQIFYYWILLAAVEIYTFLTKPSAKIFSYHRDILREMVNKLYKLPHFAKSNKNRFRSHPVFVYL